MIARQRFDVEDIKPGVAQMSGLQRVDHRGFIDQRAARGVDAESRRA